MILRKLFLNNSCNDVVVIWVGPGWFQTDLLFSISCYQGQPKTLRAACHLKLPVEKLDSVRT